MVAEGNRYGLAVAGQKFNRKREMDVAEAAKKQTLSDARKKIKWQGFEFLLHEARRDDLEVPWLRHRVRIADGTKFSTPNTPELREHFDIPNSKAGAGFYPQGWLVTLLNSTSGQPIAGVVGSYRESERDLMLKLLSECQENDLLLTDRGLGGGRVFLECYRNGIHLLHREKTSGDTASLHVQDFLASKKKSAFYGIEVEDDDGQKVLLWIRLILGPIDSEGKRIVFSTTLLDEEKYSVSSIRKLYYRRWAVETAYGRIKGLLALEKIRAKSLNGVMQEVFSNLLVLSLAAIVDLEASRRMNLDREKQVPSFVAVIEVIRDHLAFIAAVDKLSRKQANDIAEKMIHEASQIIWTKQPGRSCPRVSKQPIKSHNLCKNKKLAEFRRRRRLRRAP
jgi:hypothetical protein